MNGGPFNAILMLQIILDLIILITGAGARRHASQLHGVDAIFGTVNIWQIDGNGSYNI